jgi:threonine aldolase
MADPVIDLRSDTVTKPSPAMREAMANAEVGDDVLGDDPTAIALEEKAAALLGMEASLFVPSGTMANLIAIRAQTHHGDEVICEEDAHIVQFEVGGHAAVSGVQLRMLPGQRGMLMPEQVESRIRPANIHQPVTRLVALENTHNRASGSVYPVELVAEIARVANAKGVNVHIDGARLLNACVALGVEPTAYTQHLSSCTLCLSKGLGAPVGSMIAGSREMIDLARRYRKMLGGGMRQVGIIAAAGIYALDHNIDRLAEDHANAKRLAQGLAQLPGLSVDPEGIETNLVILDVTKPGLTAADLATAMAGRGVLFFATAAQSCRMVTHLDVTRAQIDDAITRLDQFLSCPRLDHHFHTPGSAASSPN